MKKQLIIALIAAGVAACSDSSTQPISPDLDAMVASAPDWTAAEIVRDLPVDAATRSAIEEDLNALHESLLELHQRHAQIRTLEGEEREAHLAAIKAEAGALHEKHRAIWDRLDPAVTNALHAKLQERMAQHHRGEEMKSMHERMRQLHGSGS